MTKTFAVRKEPRSTVQCSFCYYADGALGEGTIWDLSVSGWRSTGNLVIAPGFEVTAYLKLLDGNGSSHLQVEGAVVRWVQGQTMGWEITRIDEASKARLAAFVGHEVHVRPSHAMIARAHGFLSGLMDRASSAAKG